MRDVLVFPEEIAGIDGWAARCRKTLAEAAGWPSVLLRCAADRKEAVR